MDLIGYIAMVLAMVGTYVNTSQDRRCFLLWGVSNLVFICTSAYLQAWPQVGLFTFNLAMCFKGWVNWRKEGV
jgi:nicotinamide riboside transporter PnuC